MKVTQCKFRVLFPLLTGMARACGELSLSLGSPWSSVAQPKASSQPPSSQGRWTLCGAETSSCRPFLARSNLFFPLRSPSFPGSNKRNEEKAGKCPEGQGVAESNCPRVACSFAVARCSCLGSEALPVLSSPRDSLGHSAESACRQCAGPWGLMGGTEGLHPLE